MISYRVAVDVGGTFTDICIMNENNSELIVKKTSSTPENPMLAIMTGIKQTGINLKDVSLFTHGTTVATNALITRKLPRTIMICTEGFRDVIEIRRANKEDLWDTYKDVAKPYIPRRDRLTINERTDASGKIIKKLDKKRAEEICRIIKRRKAKAVSICFMNSYMNGQNEKEMQEIILNQCPDLPISISSQIMPEIFEHERFSTTVANACLSPVVVEYTQKLFNNLKEGGYKRDLLLLHSGGGVMTSLSVRDFAARLAGSGIAAGAIASRYIAMQCGFENSIGFDMGGTSTDISLVYKGDNRITKDWYVEYGYPIRFPSIEVLTIGAGGGSLAYIDEAGSLKNGPQSAGAFPGPVCYGNGNEVPTNTDANFILGRLGNSLAGGEIQLEDKMSTKYILEKIGEPLNFSLETAAEAIISVANSNMSNAVRLLSISRGYDPRDFSLVAFGGAGALHGAEIAKELSIPVVIVPPNPGITSALGCLLVDIQHDFSDSFMSPIEKTKIQDLEKSFHELEKKAFSRLSGEGVNSSDIVIERFAEMMYQGQWRSLIIKVPDKIREINDLVESFHDEHFREYNFKRVETPVSLFRVALKATGFVPKVKFKENKINEYNASSKERRQIWHGNKSFEAEIFQREDLNSGANIFGPAIVEQLDSTTYIPPNFEAKIDKYLNIVITYKDKK